MNSIMLFLSFWCFYAFFIALTTANNLTCFTHTTDALGNGTSVNATGCQYCGYHSWTGECNHKLVTERSCLNASVLPYSDTDTDPMNANWTGIDQCFPTQYSKCVQYLRICDKDLCNSECIPSSAIQYSFASASMIAVIFGIKRFINI